MYRDLLEANGVKALSEKSWEAPPQIVEGYKLLGVPEQLNDAMDANWRTVVTTLHIVDAFEGVPDAFEPSDAPLFYGKISMAEPLTNIAGMSGGPIFSYTIIDGQIRYWLFAMQSTWNKSDRTIKAVLMQPFGAWLSEVHRQYQLSSSEESEGQTGVVREDDA